MRFGNVANEFDAIIDGAERFGLFPAGSDEATSVTASEITPASAAVAARIQMIAPHDVSSAVTKPEKFQLLGVVSERSRAKVARTVQKSGRVFYNPVVDTDVETPKGTVHFAAHSVVLIAIESGKISVFDQRSQSEFSPRDRQANVSLAPGRHLTVVENQNCQFEDVNPAEFVGYRSMTTGAIGQNMKCFVSTLRSCQWS